MTAAATSPPTLPLVAIVGRPNVGKSTLINRILGSRVAIVEERPGVTRDRKEMEAEWLGRPFRLVDTGGWMSGGDELDAKVTRQSEAAIAEADVVLLVLDVTAGVTDLDARVADLLRRRDAPVIVVANKVDDPGREPMIWELMGLGLGEPFPVSALHGRGTGDLLDEVLAQLPAVPDQDEAGSDVEGEGERAGADPDEPRTVSVALVGRPNVGKSTLFNRLIGEDRAVVHDLPGTT